MARDVEEGGADPLLKAVADRIDGLRAAKGMEPAAFARAAHFSLQYLWRLQKGRMNLTLKSLSRIALALGVPISELLDGVESDPATLAVRPYERRD